MQDPELSYRMRTEIIFYLVKVYDVGSYGFLAKIPLSESNRDKINEIRRGYKKDE